MQNRYTDFDISMRKKEWLDKGNPEKLKFTNKKHKCILKN